MTTTPADPDVLPTVDELRARKAMAAQAVYDSLTRWDELAIKKAFGADPLELTESDRAGFARALIFTDLRRHGYSDKDARQASFDMPNGAVNDYFAPDEEDELSGEG